MQYPCCGAPVQVALWFRDHVDAPVPRRAGKRLGHGRLDEQLRLTSSELGGRGLQLSGECWEFTLGCAVWRCWLGSGADTLNLVRLEVRVACDTHLGSMGQGLPINHVAEGVC